MREFGFRDQELHVGCSTASRVGVTPKLVSLKVTLGGDHPFGHFSYINLRLVTSHEVNEYGFVSSVSSQSYSNFTSWQITIVQKSEVLTH